MKATPGATKRQLLAAIVKNERQKKKLDGEGDKLARRLSNLIAKELGLVVGARYKVIPQPGNAYTVTVRQIGTVSQHHAARAAKLEDLYIGVLVHCERKNGHDVFRSEWLYTNRAEFVRVKEADESAPVVSKRRRSQSTAATAAPALPSDSLTVNA